MAPGVQEAATERVKDAAKDRAAGDKPSPVGALVVALIVGVGAAVITYMWLRS